MVFGFSTFRYRGRSISPKPTPFCKIRCSCRLRFLHSFTQRYSLSGLVSHHQSRPSRNVRVNLLKTERVSDFLPWPPKTRPLLHRSSRKLFDRDRWNTSSLIITTVAPFPGETSVTLTLTFTWNHYKSSTYVSGTPKYPTLPIPRSLPGSYRVPTDHPVHGKWVFSDAPPSGPVPSKFVWRRTPRWPICTGYPSTSTSFSKLSVVVCL